jgi:hypothetical protein
MGVTNTANNFEVALAFRNAPGKLRLITLQALQVRLKRLDLNSQSKAKRVADAVKLWRGAERSRPTQLELQRDLDRLLAAVRNNQTPDLETRTHSE